MKKTSVASIITGGGRGIGKAIALRMAKDTNIIIVGRTKADLVLTCKEIKNSGGSADFCVGDIRDPKTADKTMAILKSRKWRVENLICNAGIGKSGPTEKFDKNLWREIFDVNVNGNFYFIQACLPVMMEQKSGAICLMSSVAGVMGYSHIAAYTASKHALVGLARSMAHEYGKYGIVTVPICPGFVESELTTRTIRGLMERKGISEKEATEQIAGINPQRRIIPASEVAEAVAFVCDRKVPSMSGNPLILSGGE